MSKIEEIKKWLVQNEDKYPIQDIEQIKKLLLKEQANEK